MKIHPSRPPSRQQKRRSFLASDRSRLAGRPHRRLHLEALEDRRVLATLWVDSTPGAGNTEFTAAGGTQPASVPGLTLGTDLFTTIGAAVTAAAPGDVINVADGSYSETVTVGSDVTLRGNQFGVDPAARAPGGPNETTLVATGGAGFSIGASGVEISGFSVTAGAGGVHGIAETGATAGTVLSQNFVYDFTGSLGMAIGAGSSGFVVTENELFGNHAGVYLANGAASGTVSRNVLRAHTGPGTTFPDEGSGIVLEGINPGNSITENFISGNRIGIYVWTGFGSDLSGTAVINNSITNIDLGILNTNAAVLNATLNWWGTSAAAAVAAEVSGPALIDPWLTIGNDTAPATPGFQGLLSITTGAAGTVFTGTAGSETLTFNATSNDDASFVFVTPSGAFPGTLADAPRIQFDALGGNDLLVINNPAGGIFAPSAGIFYNGGGQAGDALQNLSGAAASGFYSPGPTSDAGVLSHTGGGFTQSINFTGLAPIDDTVAEAAFVINATAAANTITVSNGPLVAATQTINVAIDAFEPINFGNKTNVDLNGLEGADSVVLAATVSATGLATLDIFGQGAGVDDNAADTVQVSATLAGVTTSVLGNGGNDAVNVSSLATMLGNLDAIAGTLNVDGGTGLNSLRISDFGGSTPNASVVITSSSVTGLAGPADATTINYTNISQSFIVEGSNTSGDVVTVLSTPAGAASQLLTHGGVDTLIGPSVPTTWNITGPGSGNIPGLLASFQFVENLVGGADADVFAFSGGGSLGGTIDGGGGTDTLDYSALATPVAVNLGANAASLAATLEHLQEVPATTSPGSGTATLTYDNVAHTIDITVTVSGIDPATVTGFHIHRGAFGVNGPIIVDFGTGGLVPDGLGGFSFTGNNIPISPLHAAALLGGITYVNVHTPTFPGGAIRGQLFATAPLVAAPGTATGTAGITGIENAIGGSGSFTVGPATFGDSLVGDNGVNLLRGGPGNDAIVGARGNDTLAGEDGNDVIAWNNGDGTDVIDGGSGSDLVQVNGDPALDDVFSIGPGAGGRVALVRTSPGPFSLDIGTTETLSVVGIGGNDTFTVGSLAGVVDLAAINLGGLAGEDTFNVTPSTTVTINVNGHAPSFPAAPGDTLNFVSGGLAVTATANSFTAAGHQPVTFLEIETFDLGVLAQLTVVGDAANNTLILRRTGLETFTYQLDSGPVIPFNRPTSAGTQFQFNGLGGDDTLIVEQNGFDEVVDLRIGYDGGASAGDNDALVIRGQETDLGVVARETYLVGATEDAGTWILDSDGNMGPGAAGAANGDETIIVFTGLEPIDSDTPAAIFDVIMNAAANHATVENGGLLNGFQSLQVTDNNATFETFRFANKTAVRLMGQSGADAFRLNATTSAAGLASLEIFGHVAGDVIGQPADDNAADVVEVNATLAGVTTTIFGGGGGDLVHNGGFAPFGTGTRSLDNFASPLTINGGAGSDAVVLSDSATAGPDQVTVTSTQIAAGAATIIYTAVETLYFEATQGNDTIDILSTQSGTTTAIGGDGGSDTITVGNTVADFAGPVFDGSLDDILGPLLILPDANGAAGAADVLNIDDSGTAALNGPASVNAAPIPLVLPQGTVLAGNATSFNNFAPATIAYYHADIAVANANLGGTSFSNRLETLNVRTSTGDDFVAVNATTATLASNYDFREGADTVNIVGDALSAANSFTGLTGNDTFTVNIQAHLGASAFAPLTGLVISGNDPAGDSENRDRLNINDINGGFVRNLNFDHLDTPGDLDILPGAAGAGLAGPVVPSLAVQVRSMETIVTTSTADNDIVRVTGTSADDDMTVVPRAGGEALVFLGGNPYLEAPPVSVTGFLPGLAGGGRGPDLRLDGIGPGGLTIDGSGTSGEGNRAIVQTTSEAALTTGGALDIFGFGPGVLIPGQGTGNAYDTINVSDAQVTSSNNALGALTTVNLATASFIQTSPPSPFQRPGLVINAGDEAAPQASGPNSGIADNITATVSANFNIQVNGNLPNLTLGADGLPLGDQLNVTGPGDINLFSDKMTPPNVTVTFSGIATPFGVSHSSIERLRLDADAPGASGAVNLIGDNNDPAVDQNDNFVVRGRDIDGNLLDAGYQEMTVVINGSAPILIDGVQRLNVYGDDQNPPPGTPSVGPNDIDTLDIRAYADNAANPPNNAPRGWGVDVFFHEGNPPGDDGNQADLIIYHTSAGLGGGGSVSEDIVIVPSGPDNGEIRATNAADGSVIVVIQYVANTDIVVLDDDGALADTDTLTLRGTNPDTVQTSGRETFAADFTAAGDLANPLVTVTDSATAAILYRLRNFVGFGSITLDPLGGGDTINVTNRAGLTVNARGGDPSAIGGANDALNVTVAGSARNQQGANSTEGRIDNAGVGDINYSGFETVSVGSTGGGTFTARGTDDNDTIAVDRLGESDLIWINDGPVLSFAGFTTLDLQGRFGDDKFSVSPIGIAVASILVSGGDPAAEGDEVIVTADGAPNLIDFSPTSIDSGTVAVGGGPTVVLSTIEKLSIDGLNSVAAGDNLTLTTPPGPHRVILDPGPTTDSGTLSVQTVGNGALLGVSYVHLGWFGSVAIADAVGQRIDELIVNGRDQANAAERFQVDPAGIVGIFNLPPANIPLTVPVLTPGVAVLRLNSLAGDDVFTVAGNHPFPVGVFLDGGEPGASDRLDFIGVGPTIVDLPLDVVVEAGFGPVNYVGIEHIHITNAGAPLTVLGTVADDRFDVQPTGPGQGSFQVFTTGSIVETSPQFTYAGILDPAFSILGGPGGFDILHLLGNESNDLVTSTPNSVTRAGGTVTVGIDLDRLDVDGFGGDDILDLSLFAALPTVINGGAGNDLIFGSTQSDVINGGTGNDTINGGAGNDTLSGNEGNDTLDGDAGADVMLGGDGSDLFIWDPGDGSDLIEGGGGESDILRFNGSAAAEVFTFNAVGTRVELLRNLGGIDMDIAGVEQIDLLALGGADSITVNDLFATDLRVLNIDAGGADLAADSILAVGRNVTDTVNLAVAAGIVSLTGLRYDINLAGISEPDADTLTFDARGGNDSVHASDDLNTLFAPGEVTILGGDGDDSLSGFGTLSGQAGNDTLVGGAFGQTIDGGDGDDLIFGGGGDDLLLGGAGEDQFVGGAGTDTIDGGDDFDTILVRGTSGGDAIGVLQSAAGTLTVTLGGIGDTDTLVLDGGGNRTVERVRVESGSGDDLIVLRHADVLGVNGPVDELVFDVDGGSAQTRDRLSVQDDGTGDLLLYRKGQSDSAGSITIGPGNVNPLENVFENVEFIQPLAGAGGQVLVFKHDPFEWNDDLINATHLGAGQTINVDPTIDPGPLDPGIPGFDPLPGDQDFYRIVAQQTGTLDIQVYFTVLGLVPSGRPGLPGAGNLDVELYDADGTLIVDGLGSFGLNDSDDDERIRIPAVEGQSYYLRVFGAGVALNNYSLTVVNTPAPVPFDLELDDFPPNGATNPPGQTDNSDTGRSQFDDITYDNTPTIFLRVSDAGLLLDIPQNGTSGEPGGPPDGGTPITIPFVPGAGPNAAAAGFRVAVLHVENNTHQIVGYAQPVAGSPGVYSFTFATPLADGSHFIAAAVEMVDPASPEQAQGLGALSSSLEIVVDTQPPPVSFGGLLPGSDTGLNTNPETLNDGVTSDTTPGFFGTAEANAVIRLFIDVPQAGFPTGNGIFEPGIDLQVGFDVAEPFDGTNQYPNGYWQIDAININLNAPPFSPTDGLRRFFVTAEDVAGNINPGVGQIAEEFEIFIDTQGPRITDVTVNAPSGSAGDVYNLFDPKPSTDGPTPLVNSIFIDIVDFPARVLPDFNQPAFKPDIAGNLGHYLVRGDANGIIPILGVNVVLDPVVNGQPATGHVELVFRRPGPDGVFNTSDDIGAPLPDDRFTLTVSEDGIVDFAGNKLDGESNAAEPHDSPPGAGQPPVLGVDGVATGDGLPGGSFAARFTVDSRPELGVWANGAAFLDINGNKIWDPANTDASNRDISFVYGFTSDDLFAGNFAQTGGLADGFDKLGAYGRVGTTTFRWLIDTDNDGVADVERFDPRNINGLPVAGRFDGNSANGDEVGLFTGTTWWFDTNHDFQVDVSIAWPVAGHAIVGDFDGDGVDDLGTWSNDKFSFDLSSIGAPGPVAGLNNGATGVNGTIERSFMFGFPGPGERPVAADMNQDGIDDIGLWVPSRDGIEPRNIGEWFFLVSGVTENDTAGGNANVGPTITGTGDATPGSYAALPNAFYGLTTYGPGRIVTDPLTPGQKIVRFQPVPFGNDQYMQFGDEFALPLVGNFDPPVAGQGGENTNTRDPLDVNNDGTINVLDIVSVVNFITQNPSGNVPQGGFNSPPYCDVTGDSRVNVLDLLAVVNHITQQYATQTAQGEGEGEGSDAYFASLGSGDDDEDDKLLDILAGG